MLRITIEHVIRKEAHFHSGRFLSTELFFIAGTTDQMHWQLEALLIPPFSSLKLRLYFLIAAQIA